MNKHQTEGAKNVIKGGVKEAAAKLTGNKAGEVEGKLQKSVGKVQTKVGTEIEKSRRTDRNAI